MFLVSQQPICGRDARVGKKGLTQPVSETLTPRNVRPNLSTKQHSKANTSAFRTTYDRPVDDELMKKR